MVLVFALIPYLLFNLDLIGKGKGKIFMGDAGSTFLGLGISWALVSFSQGDNLIFSPVTALWIFSVPLIDTIFVMSRRVVNGKSPFKPDRKHLHHFFIQSGRTDRETLFIIVSFSIVMAYAIFLRILLLPPPQTQPSLLRAIAQTVVALHSPAHFPQENDY